MNAVWHRLRRRQCGAVMAIVAGSLTLLVLFAGLVLDLQRVRLLRNHLQLAVDAAALSGAREAVPMVDLRVSRLVLVEDECWDPVTRKWYPCYSWEPASSVDRSDTRRELINQNGWRQGAPCSHPYSCRSYQVLREWFVMPSSATPVTRDTFWLNARWPLTGPLGPVVEDLHVTIDHQRAAVTATARMRAPTTFLRLAGIREIEFRRSGSAVPVRRY